MQRPRILIVTTGGTIGMLPGPDGALAPSEDGARLVQKVPEALEIADLECLSLGEQDSANVQPSFWIDVARTLYERYRDHDGFVVTHGTDTMVYLASALSFFLQELGKPIVITGAQVPLTHPGSDGRSNLVNAIRTAASDLAEVAICFGTRVMRGTRTRKTSAFDLQAITTANEAPIGRIGLDLRLADHARRRAARHPLFQPHLEERVARISVWPGMDPDVVRYLAAHHAGLVIEGYGVGTVPNRHNSLIPAIREATEKGVAVVVGTQCRLGATAPERYEVGRSALEAGAIPAMDMTPECTQVKLMWALGASRDLRTVEAIMSRNHVGELQAAR